MAFDGIDNPVALFGMTRRSPGAECVRQPAGSSSAATARAGRARGLPEIPNQRGHFAARCRRRCVFCPPEMTLRGRAAFTAFQLSVRAMCGEF
jgi:hypothetical protein